jgi:TRAP-type C4-dicarboxylate transport system substrate-binding protein
MAFNRTFNQEEQARLKKLIDEGMQVTYEIENLKEGLRDTVKAIAEEMDLKPGVLNKAIRIAHKASFQDEYDKFDELETILETVGRTL